MANGVLLLKSLNDEGELGFLRLTTSFEDEHEYRVTASLNDDADEETNAEWKCSIVMALYSRRGKESEHRFALTSDEPSIVIHTDMGLFDFHNFSSVIYMTIQDAEASAKMESESNLDTTYRFTDEAEAKKLNANCKVRFEDSDQIVYVNRELLAVYSDMFRAMFEGDYKEKDAEEIKLEVNCEDFIQYLDCLYFPPVPVSEHNFKAVAITADRYHCPPLLEKCKKFAEERAKTSSSIEECKGYIEVADQLGWNHVVKGVIKTMKKEDADALMELLDADWIHGRSKKTCRVLFAEIKGNVTSKRGLESGPEEAAIKKSLKKKKPPHVYFDD